MGHEAEKHAQGPAVHSGERRLTHQDIDASAKRAARGLEVLGVGQGDAVALLLRNDFPFFEASFAATLAGAYPVPINWHASSDDVGYILRDCSAKALIAHADLLTSIKPALQPDLPLFVVEMPAEIRAAYSVPEAAAVLDGARTWGDWLAAHDPIADPSDEARPAVIYTSGTTGRPKGVRRAGKPQSKGSQRALSVYGLDDAEPMRVLINGPMYHSVPNAYGRLAFIAGADIVLQPRFDAEELMALVERHRITHMHIVPAMFTRLLRLPAASRARYDLSSLRYVVHGAAHCPREVKAAMIDWWGPIIHEYYGSTETGLLTVHDSEDAMRKPGSVGRPLSGVTLKILDEGGREMPSGEAGDIYAGSSTLQDFTYVGNHAGRAAVGRDDLVTAGDIGWLDEEGYLFLCDRKRDVIRSNGATVYPSEIEAAILALPGVEDCAVFGAPDEQAGAIVVACVEPAKGQTLDVEDLRTRLADALDRSRLPRRIAVVARLPREDSGKIFKQKLRDIYGKPAD